MYKTIRQGENSLQYTILPQQDEGRTGPAVVHRKNGGGGAPRAGGSRKKSILAYIGLFFVCAIITFAILIPLMVTSDLMPTPTAWFYRNQKVLKGPLGKFSAENHILKGTPLRTSTSITTTTTTSTTTKGPSAKLQHSSPLESDDLSVTEFQNLYKSDESIERLEDFEQTTGRPGNQDQPTTPEMKNLLLARTRQRTMTTTTTDRATTTQQSAKNYPKHFSLQKHEIAPEQETKSIQVDTNREDMKKAHENWLQAHWSYVDPYLQWRNAADDRVVLPLILGVALTIVVVIILMCYLVKRKRMCRLCKKSATNRNTFENVEAQDGEDHENLLTNENQSEEE